MDSRYAAHPRVELLEMIQQYAHLHASAVFSAVLDGRVGPDFTVDIRDSACEKRASDLLDSIATRLGRTGDPGE